MKPEVSLITLTLNKKQLIKNLDASIAETCRRVPYQWIIVDNGDDGTHELPGIDFIRHDNSGNFATMNNMAVEKSEGETLIFLNNDMIARSDFIFDMHNLLKMNPHVGIVGACLLYPDGLLQHAGVTIQPDLFPANLGNKAINDCGLDEKKVSPIYWKEPQTFLAVTGACLAIRRKDFFDLNGFHEEFDWNFEDVDLCFRMQLHLKKRCIVSANSVLTHLESQTAKSSRYVDTPLGLLKGRWGAMIKTDVQRFWHDRDFSVSESIKDLSVMKESGDMQTKPFMSVLETPR